MLIAGRPVALAAHPTASRWIAASDPPTAQTSVGLVPQTATRSFVVLLGSADQVLPFQNRMTPCAPTAQTCVASTPQTPRSCSVVPLGATVQVAPSHARIS